MSWYDDYFKGINDAGQFIQDLRSVTSENGYIIPLYDEQRITDYTRMGAEDTVFGCLLQKLSNTCGITSARYASDRPLTALVDYFMHPEKDAINFTINFITIKSRYVESYITSACENFNVMQVVSKMFMRQTDDTLLFVGQKDNQYLVGVKNDYIDKYTRLLIFTAIGKKINNTEDNVHTRAFTNIKKALAASNKTKEEKINDVDKILANWLNEDFPEVKVDIEKRIQAILKDRYKSEKQSLQSTINNLKGYIEEYMDSIAKYSTQLRESQEKLALYNCQDNSKLEKDLRDTLDLLTRSKVIKDWSLKSNSIDFTVAQPIEVNNKEEWARVNDNIFSGPLAELMRKTLIDEEFKLYTEATIRVSFRINKPGRIGGESSIINEHAIPHPHIQGYNCFGQHKQIIAECLAENDFIGTVEQCIEAERGLAWADGAVTDKLHDYLTGPYYYSRKAFQDKDGKWFSAEDWEKEHETN